MKELAIKIVKIIKNILLVLMVIIALPFIVVIIRAFFKPALNDEYRKEAMGQFIQLSKGTVHYEFNDRGPEAPVIILLHGITVPMIVWENTVPALNTAGISTVRFDYYGRGYSDRPKVAYKSELFSNQAFELLDSLGIDKPVHIMGVSLGGAITASITASHPDRIASATLVDPAVSWAKENSAEEKREHLKKRFKKLITALTNGRTEEKPHMTDFQPHIRAQFKYRGIEFSLLSMAFNNNLGAVLPACRKIAADNNVPVEIIWGDEDKLLPVALGVKLSQEMPQADFHIIKGGGHTPHYERPKIVNPLLVEFIKTHSVKKSPIKIVENSTR